MEAYELYNRWLLMWRKLNAKGDPFDEYFTLTRLYSMPLRAYHNLGHIAKGLEELNEDVRNLAEHPDEIEFSYWYHDSIYDVKRKDNEEKSAETAYKISKRIGQREEFAKRVKELILITKHIEKPKNIDERIIVDMDLAVLGSPYEEFKRYRKAIREEYSFVNPPLYKEERIRLLERFLKKEHIYQTDYFRNKYEPKAEENLKMAIEELKKEKI